VVTRAGCNVAVGDLLRIGGVSLYGGVRARVGAVTPHPRWVAGGDGRFDVAVVRLAAGGPSAAALAAAGVVPARLNGWAWATDGSGPASLRVAGYGSTRRRDGAGGSFDLRLGRTPLAAWSACTPYTSAVPVAIDRATQVCALPVEGGDPPDAALCERDGGSPLYDVYEWGGAPVYQLYGVASYWLARADGAACPYGLPNVFVKVEPLREWIWKTM